MDKKEYIIRQLGRTKNKKYEAYVINRIIHLLNDFDIKFVTQQYVTRPEGRALIDLFFPQVNLHIEVDEPYHKDNVENDKIREADIVNATNHEVLRVDVSKSIEDINSQIHEIVEKIRSKIKQLKDENLFTPWDIDLEFNPETYIKRGYIDISDNVAFKTIKDACNCFGHNYAGWMQGGAPHPDSNILLWFPKLFPNGEWLNNISPDEETITERNEDDAKAREHLDGYINKTNGKQHKRIVFANVKGNLGDRLYRFRGLYELSVKDSGLPIGLVWQRKLTRVKTYPHNIDRSFNDKNDNVKAAPIPETVITSKAKSKTSMRANPKQFLSEKFPELLHCNIVSSRMYENKEKKTYLDNWWFKFDHDILKSNDFIVFAGALDYENKNFRLLKVPTSYILQNIDKIDINKKNWISLYIHMNDLIDIRNTSNLSFRDFSIN